MQETYFDISLQHLLNENDTDHVEYRRHESSQQVYSLCHYSCIGGLGLCQHQSGH